MKYVIVLFVVLITHSGILARQEQNQAKDSSKLRRLTVLPVPTLGSAPETGFYFGAVALFNFKLFDDTLTRNSNAKLEFSYTLKRQIITRMEWLVTGKRNGWIWLGNNAFLKFPENIWSVGSRATAEEQYEANRIEMLNGYYYKVHDKWYAGPVQRLQRLYNISTKEGGLLFNKLLPGSEGGLSSGLGAGLFYDSRFNLLNAEAGAAFLSLRYLHFGKMWGSNYTFNTVEVDARHYIKGLKEMHIWALQTIGIFNAGHVPFRMMGLLGSDAIMRGYYQGRYRDKVYVATQQEYRMPVWRWLGVTAFTAVGQVAPDISSLSTKYLKGAAGIGLRIKVDKQENTNMRFDYAIGTAGGGFYVSFGEAF
jgi:hypothetical protein